MAKTFAVQTVMPLQNNRFVKMNQVDKSFPPKSSTEESYLKYQ